MAKLLTLLPIALLIILSACDDTVERPDTNVCVINIPFMHKTCRNLKNDYDDNGHIILGHAASVIPINSIDDVNKLICTDGLGWANVKNYQRALRGQK